MLEAYIKERLKQKPILLMTHIVMGAPDFDGSYEIVKQMVDAGVDLMELQIPFSEPMADGPVIMKANQTAIENGSSVSKCFEFAERVAADFSIPFLFMSYTNILFKYGMERFSDRMAAIGLKGAIVPDLPPEEASNWMNGCKDRSLDNILIFTPTHTEKRLKELAASAGGFVYCVGRRGVTGKKTAFDDSLDNQIQVYRRATELPLALGFGIQEKADIDFLKGKIDIAVIGSRLIEIQEESGSDAVKDFLLSIRNT